MTKDEAVKLYDSKFWHFMTNRERATFQLFEERLCMPFDVFHVALEKCLERPVFTHELGSENVARIKEEFLHGALPPTLTEILGLIPAEKRIIVEVK